jgi:riboflavin biosynthesis pyrimidine reductase
VTADPRIRWEVQRERRFPFGLEAPLPAWGEAIGFPPPWPDRPWIYATMVASTDGVVAWRRAGPGDDPVLAVLGGDRGALEAEADRRHLRVLRCFGDVALGAGTLREQPGLVPLPREPGEPPAPALARFRRAHGLPPEPRVVVYSLAGALDVDLPLFNTPGVEAIVVTTARGAAALRSGGAEARGLALLAEDVETPAGLRRAHERLFAERGVRYLDCEGGATVLRALLAAGLLDEVFVTVTPVVVGASAHAGVQRLPDLPALGAELVAEGRGPAAGRWRFQRWRLNPR